jgi:hypothetical protein
LIKPNNVHVLQTALRATCDYWLNYNIASPETTSQVPVEGVVSLDRLGRPCELIPSVNFHSRANDECLPLSI